MEAIPAAAGTATPGSAHGDKLARGLDRHTHTQERKQLDTGQTNFLFSKMWYYHPDTTALFQIHLGSLSRTNSRPCLQVPCKKDKAMQQPPTGIGPPPTHTPGHIHLSSEPPWERHRVIGSRQPPTLFTFTSVRDCEAPVSLQVKSVLS